jgi:tetratricopeptide (TPR) repeat protein
MKKLSILLAVCFATGLAFGQKKSVNLAKNEIKSLKPNIEEARTHIKGALENAETKDNAETWYVAGQVENKAFDTEKAKEYLGQKPNEDLMYPALARIYPYFLKANELDQLPDAKGKVKPKFQKDIRAIMAANRPYYTNAGFYFHEKGDYKQAYENFRFYGDMPSLPLFEGDAKAFANQPSANDSNVIQIRYYAALSAAAIPMHAEAIELYNEVKDLGWNENEIYQRLDYEYIQLTDTASRVALLKLGIDKFPEDSYYILSLISIYINQEKTGEAVEYLQKAIANTPNDSHLHDVLGLVYENTKEVDKAIASIKKALEIDPENADALSHLGRLYYNSGVEKRGVADGLSDPAQYSAAIKEADDYFKQCIPYFEKAYQINPENKDAVLALRNSYYSLKNNDEYEKWNKIYEEN